MTSHDDDPGDSRLQGNIKKTGQRPGCVSRRVAVIESDCGNLW